MFEPSGAFAVFAEQDSGCVSYGVERAGRRWFVKSGPGLLRALDLHRAVRHPAIVRPVAVLDGPVLVYPWCPGEVLNAATVHGSDRSGLERFRRQPLGAVLGAVNQVLDAHLAVADAGFVAVDLYDGSFLWDAGAARMRLIDLDDHRRGPFVLDADRLPGSRRYMAPEEFRRGATIDQRTTVHVLGRAAQQLLDGPSYWRGTREQRTVTERATQADPAARYPSVAALVAAWRSATG
jgi:hypothetical protein